MGWGSGTNADGREIGYLVDAVCDRDGCDTKIDRGLAFCCGGMHDGGEHGCGRYFCYDHLFFPANTNVPRGRDGQLSFMCEPCCDTYDAAHPEEADAEAE